MTVTANSDSLNHVLTKLMLSLTRVNQNGFYLREKGWINSPDLNTEQ